MEQEPFTPPLPSDKENANSKEKYVFSGFLEELKSEDINISTAEWLVFLEGVGLLNDEDGLRKAVEDGKLLDKIETIAMVTLVKNKDKVTQFREVFQRYFGNIAQIIEANLPEEEEKEIENAEEEQEEVDQAEKKVKEEEKDKNEEEKEQKDNDKKESLGVDIVLDKITPTESSAESMHGGETDQHNDILRQQDESKKGGGSHKGKSQEEEEKENSRKSFSGKGNDDIEERKPTGTAEYDSRMKYERRPTREKMGELVSRMRQIVLAASEVRTGKLDIRQTVSALARMKPNFIYERERQNQAEVVLFIDVGGPVDEWSPLVKQMAEEMSRGLSKLEIYLFHNNMYGYVWPLKGDIETSNYAGPNSLLSIKDIVRPRKRVIVYGDAEMSSDEFDYDNWEPQDNDSRVRRFGMRGGDCLQYIKRNSKSSVWINPVFKKEWEQRDDSGTIRYAGDIIKMYDLSEGGVEDAIKELMRKR